jgi:hypothetical protein
MDTVSWETSLGNHGTVKRVSFTKEEDGATRRFDHTVYEVVGKEPALKMSRQLNLHVYPSSPRTRDRRRGGVRVEAEARAGAKGDNKKRKVASRGRFRGKSGSGRKRGHSRSSEETSVDIYC